MSFTRELDVALQAAKTAGEIAFRHRAKGLNPVTKPDDSPVTAADKESEQSICRALEGAFPDDGLFGEEGAHKDSHNGRRWIIDPIDGTRDFIRGLPLWSTMIALEDRGETQVGVVHFPPLGQTYWASRGEGAFRDDKRLRASPISVPEQAVLSLNGLNKMAGRQIASKVLRWATKFWSVRSLGGTLDAMLVAAGEADMWIEASDLSPWDLAAPQVILEEAGAVYCDFNGERNIYSGRAAACTPALEQELRLFLETIR